jgi:recombinational DNA repair protein RecR
MGGELDYLDEGTLAAAIQEPAHYLAFTMREK